VIEVVLGDVHARAPLLSGMLDALGVFDSRGRRRGGFWIVQVGDLLDRRAEPGANLRTAKLATQAIDVALAGNHEVRMLADGGSDHAPALATLATRGWPHAAAELGGWLVTHAGVHPELTHGLPRDAGDCAREINDQWHRRASGRVTHPLFDWVGPGRGGIAPYGGIFWGDASEWPPHGRTPWGQVCGHVPQPQPRLLPGPRWLIDLGTRDPRLGALVRRHGDDPWTPLVLRLSSRGATLTRLSSKRAAAIAA
jgi:hypothetical protein